MIIDSLNSRRAFGGNANCFSLSVSEDVIPQKMHQSAVYGDIQ
jgi:hypothetical protein